MINYDRVRQIDSDLRPIDGHFQLRVGTETDEGQVYVGDRPDPNPLVTGVYSVYRKTETVWWRVYMFGGGGDEDEIGPIVDTDKKEDTIRFLEMLRDEVQQAVDVLKTM
jgi:hypothetical protein